MELRMSGGPYDKKRLILDLEMILNPDPKYTRVFSLLNIQK